jgi:hypothetical protein
VRTRFHAEVIGDIVVFAAIQASETSMQSSFDVCSNADSRASSLSVQEEAETAKAAKTPRTKGRRRARRTACR